MVNDCLGTLVELMLERIEKLEAKVERLEEGNITYQDLELHKQIRNWYMEQGSGNVINTN